MVTDSLEPTVGGINILAICKEKGREVELDDMPDIVMICYVGSEVSVQLKDELVFFIPEQEGVEGTVELPRGSVAQDRGKTMISCPVDGMGLLGDN